VAHVSRAVSDALDDSDALGGSPYVLEVTSPGVDRPLTERRHWSRARGRLVVATVTDAGDRGHAPSEVTGRVVAVTDDGVTLDTEGDHRLLPWPTLGKGAVQVEFNRPAADGDAAGTEAQET
jgi:ribosome maturation factor RimP